MHYEYIDTAEGLRQLVSELEGESLLGIDTEAAGYHRYHDRISLVQISSRRENFLIDPVALRDLSALHDPFGDLEIEKIFHDADFDLRILDRDLGIRVHHLFDTQIAAAFVGERSLGLAAVVERYLGLSLPKAFQRADWAERPLSEGMREYAATDTAYLPELREKLIEQLERKGRLAWAREEFGRREAIRWSEPANPEEAFLRIKGARDLTPRGLAILRELYGWREEVGRERDQATFRILSNQAMLALALTAPNSLPELRATSGISGGMIDRRGPDLLAAIARGRGVPESELPRFPLPRRWERDPEVELRSERLRSIRNRRAEELDLDPGFLISRALLDEIARRAPHTLEELSAVPDLRRWQIEAVGEALLNGIE